MRQSVCKRRMGALLLSFSLLMPAGVVFASDEETPSREIHVVYDDSGSMYLDNSSKPVDRWSKAKYSMEVFASMLGAKDTMDIYYMSDYSEDKNGTGPRLSLHGSDRPQENVEAIHNETTASGSTPFEAVEAARDDLETSDADEKWLVVLTDGDFQFDGQTINDKSEVKARMDEYFVDPGDVNVVFLAIGEQTVTVSERPNAHVYCEVASDSDEILDKVTEVSNRIFNANRIDVPADSGTFTLDVPMSELTVFVQGDKAQINGLLDESGKAQGEMSPAVTVSATDQSDNSRHPHNEPDTSLHGQTAVFDGPFAPGKYKVQTEGASSIEVYFKPELALRAYLIDENGTQIENFTDLKAGDYTIHFDLVSGLDGSDLPQKNLISQSGIEYEAIVTNNGKTLDPITKNDSKVTLEQGSLDIDVTATFLRYNKARDTISNEIFDHKVVTFALDDNTAPLRLDGKGLNAEDEVRVIMKINGSDISASEWAQVKAPEIRVEPKDGYPIGELTVEKTEEPGILLVRAGKQDVSPAGKTYETLSALLSASGEVDGIPWQGDSALEMPLKDTRNWFIRNLDWLLEHLWMFITGILLVILAILYARKKRFGKMEKLFEIEMVPKDPMEEIQFSGGKFEKDASSVWLPAVAETGVITLSAQANSDTPIRPIHLRAAGGGQMEVVNIQSYAGQPVAFNGKRADDWLAGQGASSSSSSYGGSAFGTYGMNSDPYGTPSFGGSSAEGSRSAYPNAASAPVSSSKKPAKKKNQKKQPDRAKAFLIRPGQPIVIDGRQYTITLCLKKPHGRKKRR